MAKQAPATTRELRQRRGNGLAFTSLTTSKDLDGDFRASNKSPYSPSPGTKKGKAGATSATTKKKAPPKKTSGIKSINKKKPKVNTKAATPKTANKSKITKSAKPSPGEKSSKQVRYGSGETGVEKRKILVWPPYINVREIPAEHRQYYKDYVGQSAFHKPSDLHPSIPKTQPPQSYVIPKSAIQNPMIIALRARYKVVFQCPKTGACRAKCVEPGWQDVHSRGEEVWFTPDRIVPPHTQKGPPKEVELGFALVNGESPCFTARSRSV